MSIASVLVLTGCSQVGAAATIGSTKITQAQVQTSIDTILAERAKVDTSQMQLETGEALNRSQLRFFIVSKLLHEVAADDKITVTKAEIDTRRASIISQIGGADKLPQSIAGAGIASINLDAYLELIIISEKMTTAATAAGVDPNSVGAEIQKQITAKADTLKITVNPRYGKWDAVAGDIVANDPASPAASPATAP